VTAKDEKGNTINFWYSGKHKAFGGNVQFLSTADGFPLWCSEVFPGGSHDLATAREHGAIGALCAAAAEGLSCLADKGHCFAGIGIHAPIKTPPAARSSMSTTAATTVCSPGFAAWANELQRYCSAGGTPCGGSRYAHRGSAPSPKPRSYSTQVEHQGRY
jgi:hypothetical protein